MLFSIIRRASLIMVLGLVVSCNRTPLPEKGDARCPPPAVIGGAIDAPLSRKNAGLDAAETDEPAVQISSFDCEKASDAPGFPPSHGPLQGSIATWRGGGPNGANWNVDDLRCVIEIATECSTGSIWVQAHVGSRRVAQTKVDIVKAFLRSVELEIPWKAWHRNVDEPAVPERPYRTAVFRASAELTCTAPTTIDARASKHSFAIADAAFVAGLATGE